MLALPYSGLVCSSAAAKQSLTSTAGKVTAWSAVGQAGSDTIDGDPSVKADRTNNRLILATPGTYLVLASISGVSDAPGDLLLQVRKNGTTIQSDLAARVAAPLSIYQISAAPTGIPSGNISAGETADEALTGITGLLAADLLLAVQKPANQNGLFLLPADLTQGGVTGDGAATVKYVNVSSAGITPTAAETYVFTVLRAGRCSLTLAGILSLAAADSQQLASFADVTSTVSQPDFTGNVGASSSGAFIDLVLATVSGSLGFIVEAAQFSAIRLG